MEFSILIIPWILVFVSALAGERNSGKSVWYMSLITYLGVGVYTLYLLPDYFGTDNRLLVEWHLDHEILPLMLGFHMHGLALLLLSFATVMTFMVYLLSARALLAEQRIASYCLNINIFTATWMSIILSASLLQIVLGLAILSFLSYTMITQYHKQTGVKSAAERVVFIYRFADILLIFVLTGMFSLYDSFNIYDILQAGQDGGNETILRAFITIFALSIAIHSGLVLFHTGASDIAESATGMVTLLSSTGTALFSVYMIATFYPLLERWEVVIDVLTGWVFITITWVAIRSLMQTHIRRIAADLSNIQVMLLMFAVLSGGTLTLSPQLFMYMASQFLLFGFLRSILYLTSSEFDVRKMGGLARRAPMTAVLAVVYALFATGAIFIYGFDTLPTGFILHDSTLVNHYQGVLSAGIVFINTLVVLRLISYTLLGTCRMSEQAIAYMREPYEVIAFTAVIFAGVVFYYTPLYLLIIQPVHPFVYDKILDMVGLIMILAVFVAVLLLPSHKNIGLVPTLVPDEPKWANKLRKQLSKIGVYLWHNFERYIMITPAHSMTQEQLTQLQKKFTYKKTTPAKKHLFIPMLGTIFIFVLAVIYEELF